MADKTRKVLKELQANEAKLVALQKQVEHKNLVGRDTSHYMVRAHLSNVGVTPQSSNK